MMPLQVATVGLIPATSMTNGSLPTSATIVDSVPIYGNNFRISFVVTLCGITKRIRMCEARGMQVRLWYFTLFAYGVVSS